VLAQYHLLLNPGPFLARLREAHAAVVGTTSRRGGGRGGGELLKAMEGLATKKKMPQIALEVYGADMVVEKCLESDGDLRARAHGLVK